MLNLTRVSVLKAKQSNRFSWRRITPRRSSTSTQTQLAPESDQQTSRDKECRLDAGPEQRISQPEHLREILLRHQTQLKRAFDLQESPKVTLMLPGSFSFEPADEPSKQIKISPPLNQKTKVVTKTKSKKALAKNRVEQQSLYAAQRQHIMSSLKCYVDVSVHVGQYELALQAVNYYRWYLKRLHQRLSSEPPEVFPVDIYNGILSGCASTGDFNVASEVRQLMSWDNTNLNASSYAYLLAAAKGKDDMMGIIKSMSEANISLNDLFLETSLTTVQLGKLLSNIRNCDNNQDFEIPRFLFKSNETCKLTSGLKEARTPFHGKRILDEDLLREQTAEQKKRELAGLIRVKSVAAAKTPTDRVIFLRQQVARCENDWRNDLNDLFDKQLEAATNQALHLHEMSVYPYLLALEKSSFIELMIQEMRSHALASETFSMGISYLASELGRKVENLYHIQTMVKRGILNTQDKVYDEYLSLFDPRHSTPSRELWQSLITKHSHVAPCIENYRSCPWPNATRSCVGYYLYSILRLLKVDVNILQPNCGKREMMNALYSVYRSSADRTKEEVKAHKVLHTLYARADLEELHFDVSQVPMLCPPKPWCHAGNTPFLISSSTLIRVVGDKKDRQMNAVNSHPPEMMHPSLDALNVLSRTPWKVNKPVLDVLTEVFLGEGNSKLSVPKNPGKLVPPELTSLRAKSKAAARNESLMFRREKAETHSLWCDMLYKLSIAHHFKDSIFFFPHNMDFRGRVYPIPPHFQHLGGDSIRGLLLFGEGQPLGKTGLRWLKLHLINLTGSMKRQSVEERVKHADEILEDIIDSAKNPLTGRKWWQDSDDPWQTLAACMEIANALESPDLEKYVCHLPIHQDGSCNGLQHYAALGRDLEGAMQVNLCPRDTPLDVYTGISDEVESRRKADSEAGNEIAKILEGHITRKVVKQTVMTVVYGVTRYGAFHQILGQLEDRQTFPVKKASAAARYLVEKTFSSLQQMFTSSRMIQNWFADCARAIVGATNEPVRWTTPLGLPVVQPYYKTHAAPPTVKSDVMKRPIQIAAAEPCKMKQKNGFPPNFVHSLDSAHMMLTAMYSEAAGINFVSVHDCYWTHVSTVDIMNKICREQFVALHSEPILENLAKELRQNYGRVKPTGSDSKASAEKLASLVKEVPEKGKLDLREVLKSTYFFS